MTLAVRRWPRGFSWLIAAQFSSALADNALLIVTIALLQEQGWPGWWAPLLKFGFTLSYVLLAPFVGPLADAFAKARLMAVMNGVKALGVLALLAGVQPVLAFAVVGFGAAAYAPCKYGLITEIVPPDRLVAANGWIEVSVVCAALLGTVLGGGLVSPWLLGQAWVQQGGAALAGWPLVADDCALTASLGLLLLVYALAGGFNLGVVDSAPRPAEPAAPHGGKSRLAAPHLLRRAARYAASACHPGRLLREFWADQRRLWRDPEGGLSLAVTTLFWGLGATLQFAVLRWAADALQLPLSQAAYLQAAVAVGVVLGAGGAGRWVPLRQARRVLPAGVLLGLMIPLVAAVHTLALALPLLVMVGVVGGVLVVPLNALLQHRGCQLLSAGRSIAVQGCSENASILAMLAGYAALLMLDAPIVPLMSGFGLAIAAAMLALAWRGRRVGLPA